MNAIKSTEDRKTFEEVKKKFLDGIREADKSLSPSKKKSSADFESTQGSSYMSDLVEKTRKKENQGVQEPKPTVSQSQAKSNNKWPLSVSPVEQTNIDNKPKFDENNSEKESAPAQFLSIKRIERCFTIDDFELSDKIGKGAMGDVYKARDSKTGFFCALKKMSKKRIR